MTILKMLRMTGMPKDLKFVCPVCGGDIMVHHVTFVTINTEVSMDTGGELGYNDDDSSESVGKFAGFGCPCGYVIPLDYSKSYIDIGNQLRAWLLSQDCNSEILENL